MFSSAFVKTNQVYQIGSEAKEAETDPKEGVGGDEDDYEVYEPEKGGKEVGDPEEAIIEVMNFDIGVCGLKNPLFFL